MNTLPFFEFSLPSNLPIYSNMNINIEIDTLRDWSNVPNTNSSRELLAHSSASFISYIKRIKILDNCSFGAKQVENNISQGYLLSYVFLKVGDTNNANKAIATENIAKPYRIHINNLDTSMSQPQGLEMSSISYLINQLANPNL